MLATLRWFCLSVLMGLFSLQLAHARPVLHPMHLVDIWWDCEQSTPDLKVLTFDFEILSDISSDHNFYLAPLGWMKLSDIGAYGGIQTNTYAWNSIQEKKHFNMGKGGIFSRWSKKNSPVPLHFVKGDQMTFFETAGYEGEFGSVRTRYTWGKGRYAFIVEHDEAASTVGYPEGRWYKASLLNKTTQEKKYIGSLFFEGTQFNLERNMATFIELYGASFTEVPEVAIIFNEPVINGQACRSRMKTNYDTKHKIFAGVESLGAGRVLVRTYPEGQ